MAGAEPITHIQRLSPEPETPEEDFQPLEFPFFEDESHEDFGNTSKYSYLKRPPVPITPLDPLDKEFLRESISELTSILSSEWVEEAKLSSEEIQIRTPSLTIQCKICGIWVDVLYNPIVGANVLSASFTLTYLGDEPLAPTSKSFRIAQRSSLEGLGILHNITVQHVNAKVALDFHVFEI